MPIDEKSIKKLWGQAAGRCSKPGCREECIKFFDAGGTVIGEMAHVIAKSGNGPRGIPGGGSDDYENLILLCPTHHRMVDKAPAGTFSVDELHNWKNKHEVWVRHSLGDDTNITFDEALEEVNTLLDDNYEVWKEYGPLSDRAKQNPFSNISELWEIRRVAQIVPNNTRICNIIDQFTAYFDREEVKLLRRFKDHAQGYQLHCYSPLEDYAQFPSAFREMIEKKCRTISSGTSVTAP